MIKALQNPASKYQIQSTVLKPFMNALFQRSVIEDKPGWKIACIRTMHALHDKYPQGIDMDLMPYLLWLIQPKSTTTMFRDNVLRFIDRLCIVPINGKRLVAAEGLPTILHYISSVHKLNKPNSKRLTQTNNNQTDHTNLQNKNINDNKEPTITAEGKEVNSTIVLVNSNDSKQALEVKTPPKPSTVSATSKSEEKNPKSNDKTNSNITNRRATTGMISDRNNDENENEDEEEVSNEEGDAEESDDDENALGDEMIDDDWDMMKQLPTEFNPAELSAISIRIVRSILGTVPKAKKVAAKLPQLLPTLLQLMLCEVPELGDEALTLLLYILDTSLHLVPYLVTNGNKI